MIESITINNYALIDKTYIDMEKGLSIITGETGAGKSILLGAIGLTLGQRADSAAIQDKSKKCIVEIVYHVGGYHLQDWFAKNDLDYSDSVVVRREVTAEGKSRGFINDTPVNNKLLKEFGSFLIDIHSQHQALLLGQPEYQIEVLDSFCNSEKILSKYKESYHHYQQLTAQLNKLKKQEAEDRREEDYLRFQFNQLESAQLHAGEKEDLEKELQLLTNAENIKSVLGGITWQLRDTDQSMVSILKNLRNGVNNIADALPAASEYRERLDSVVIELNDIADEAERKAEGIEYDSSKIDSINKRLNVIYELLYKYKVETVDELIAIYDEIDGKLQKMSQGSFDIESLEKKIKVAVGELTSLSEQIHDLRDQSRGKLCDELKHLLMGLGIRHADFVVKLDKLDHFTSSGCDDVKFLFSANKNQQPGEISKVASGGEISRVMLALKYILSLSKQLPVMVFDEIDTGLSGEVAHRMAQMMKEMSTRMQVISISHLPQIAAAGDCHFKVYKEDNQDATISHIKKLTPEERIHEIAGMMSGSEISESALKAATDLLK